MRSTLPSGTDPRPGPDTDLAGSVYPTPDTAHPLERLLPWVLLLSGLLGVAAALVLSVEKVALLSNSDYVPTCNLNPVLNCGSIMRTDQAEVFGFPNPFIGLIAFPILACTGAVLLAGARLRRWYWFGLQVGVTLGIAFVGWLVFQSLYRINALCPYCMVVWAVVLPTFWYVTLTNLARGALGTRAQASRITQAVTANHAVILTVAYLTLVALAVHRFWDYWTTVVG